ncbi:MAG: outer membrane lipoprotein chaperone LolA [Betaproteobacteria bacterium]|nr:outer membrane lipoprotein chaperone LolA [Betaproteobacteria bacterium]
MRNLFLGLSLALLALPAQAENRLQAFVGQTKALSAQFSQTVYDRNGRKTQEASGTFQLQRPGKFRWAYQKPYEQLIVGDGKRVWIYDADLAQVTVRPFDRAVGESPAALLAGNNEIEKFFRLKETGRFDNLDWVEATPKSQEGSFERVRIGFKGDDLDTMELKDRFGQTTLLRFSKLQRNPALPAELFRFAPPKGVDVIGND